MSEQEQGSWCCSVSVEVNENSLNEEWKEIDQIGPKKLSGKAWGHKTGYFIRELKGNNFEANYPGNYLLGMFPSLRNAQIACLAEEAFKRYLVKELGEEGTIRLL